MTFLALLECPSISGPRSPPPRSQTGHVRPKTRVHLRLFPDAVGSSLKIHPLANAKGRLSGWRKHAQSDALVTSSFLLLLLVVDNALVTYSDALVTPKLRLSSFTQETLVMALLGD